MIHPQLLVAPVPSVSHTCTQVVTVVLLYTGTDDLASVKKFVKSVVDWQSLGLELGLLYPTLKRIKKEQHGDINDCIMEMLVAWLQQQDNVREKGVPSWSVLRKALEKIGGSESIIIVIYVSVYLHSSWKWGL